MSIDIYQNCPVHMGKKIKFCCGKEVVAELDHILELFRSKQPTAALDAIAKAESKLGQNDSLLNLKTRILVSLNETAQAEESNRLFMAANPGHMLGHQHQALIHAQKEEIPQAVEALQHAADAVGDSDIPFTIINAFRVVGAALMTHGDPIAGRYHLNFFKKYKPDETKEIDYLIFQAFGSPHIPMPLKAEHTIKACPETTPCYKHNRAIVLLSDRGRWSTAISVANTAMEQFPGESILVRNLAVLQSILGRHREASEYWRKYAVMENIADWERLESEAVAMLLNSELAAKPVEVVKTTWNINDTDRAVELALDNKQFANNPVDTDPNAGPPPRGSFAIWNIEPKDLESTTSFTDLPIDTGFFHIFGKQTDRSARIELVARSGKELDSSKTLIQTYFASVIDGESTDDVLGIQSQENAIGEWRTTFPEQMPPKDRREMQKELERARIKEIWPSVEYGILDGKTLREAATDHQFQLSCRAIAWIMHLSVLNEENALTAVEEVCSELSIELPGDQSIDVFADAVIPISWMHKIDPTVCNQHELNNMINWAMIHRNILCLRRGIPELLKADELDNPSRCNLLWTYARVVLDNDEAIQSIHAARDVPMDESDSRAVWLVRELEIRMERGMEEGVAELFKELSVRANSDEQVAEEFAQLLIRFNLIRPDGQPNSDVAGDRDEAQDEPHAEGIWTPDQEPSEVGSGSKLWVPGDE